MKAAKRRNGRVATLLRAAVVSSLCLCSRSVLKPEESWAMERHLDGLSKYYNEATTALEQSFYPYANVTAQRVVVVQSEEPALPTPVAQTERYAYVTGMFLGTKYLCGAVMLAWKLRNRDPSIDLAVFVAGRLGEDEEHKRAMRVLRKAGYKIYNAPILMNPFDLKNPRFRKKRYNYCKINMYAMTDYTKIVYVDSDIFFPNGAPDKLFSLHDGRKPAGRFFSYTEINAGFMVARPNITLYWDMLSKFNSLNSETGGDQDFQNQYFNKYQDGFEEFKNFGINMRQVFNSVRPHYKEGITIPANRHDPPPHMGVYHPFGVKPWQCPRNVYCERDTANANKYVWPQVVDHWWREFDEMAKQWRWILKDEYKDVCIREKVEPTLKFSLTKEELLKQKTELQLERK